MNTEKTATHDTVTRYEYEQRVGKNLFYNCYWMMQYLFDDNTCEYVDDIEVHNQWQYINEESESCSEEQKESYIDKLKNELSEADEEENEEKAEEIQSKIDQAEEWESEPQEALTHIIINEYLATYLIRRGELVLKTPTFYIWGRQTYGQAWDMDTVIEDFARDCLKIIIQERYK